MLLLCSFLFIGAVPRSGCAESHPIFSYMRLWRRNTTDTMRRERSLPRESILAFWYKIPTCNTPTWRDINGLPRDADASFCDRYRRSARAFRWLIWSIFGGSDRDYRRASATMPHLPHRIHVRAVHDSPFWLRQLASVSVVVFYWMHRHVMRAPGNPEFQRAAGSPHTARMYSC